MPQDKKIPISVDDSAVSRLRQSANDLMRDLIRSSRSYSTSSKEVLKDIEEQIRLIEKRNKLDEEGQRTSLLRQRISGEVSKPEFRQKIEQVTLASREDKLQVELLRELIDTIKANAKEEIRENRQFVEKTIRRDKSIESLAPDGDPEEILKRTIQRGILGKVGERETEEKRAFRYFGSSVGAGTNRTLTTVAGSQNEFMMAAAALAMIPFVGQGLSMVASRIISGAEKLERSTSGLAAISGGSIESQRQRLNEIGGAGFFSKLGLSEADVAQRLAGFTRVSGGRIGNLTAMDLLAMERTLGIERGTMMGLAGIQRYDTRTRYIGGRERLRFAEMSPEELRQTEMERLAAPVDVTGRTMPSAVDREMAAMKAADIKSAIGADKESVKESVKKDLRREETFTVGGREETTGIRDVVAILKRTARGNNAVLQEMLGTFTGVSNQILSISGNIDMGQTAAVIHGISRSTGTQGRQLERVVGGIQGLSGSQNPVVRTLMARAFREAAPSASWFEIQSMMENPVQNIGAIQSMIDNLRMMTGGGEMYQQALYSMFGGKISRTDILEIGRGGDFSKMFSEAEKARKIKPPDRVQDLPGIIGITEQSTALIESLTQNLGLEFVGFIDKAIEGLKSTVMGLFGETPIPSSRELEDSIARGVKRGMQDVNRSGM